MRSPLRSPRLPRKPLLPPLAVAEVGAGFEAAVVAAALAVAEVAGVLAAMEVAAVAAAVDDGSVPAWAAAGVIESAGETEPRHCHPPESAWRNRVL